MNQIPDPRSFETMKFGVGQPVPRAEDPVLVQGQGRYTDDLALEGQLYAAFVRAPVAHGTLRGIDAEAALAMPGVRAVYTAADLEAAGYGAFPNAMPFKNRDGSPMNKPAWHPLATDRVRFVGDLVACVVADTMAEARDAAEAVALDIEGLDVVTTPEAALAEGAPLLHDDAPGNLAIDFQTGDAEATERAFAAAAHVTTLDLSNNRLVVNPMEPRSGLASYEDGRFTLRVGCQGVFGLRNTLADSLLKVDRDKLRVLTGHVGGSFGMKAQTFPEYICLLHAAKALGAPVRWTDTRSESFLADPHGRDVEVTAELALDAEGHFLAFRVRGTANVGAYLTQVAPLFSTGNIAKNMVGVYRTPVYDVAIRAAFTNTTPIGAYRGAGRPEGNYFMERLIDAAAAETGRDRLALRRLNHIPADAMPYQAPTGSLYDGGDFTAVLDRAVAAADWDGFEARRRESEARGLLRGIGLGDFLEVTAPPQNEMGGIRFEKDGLVTIVTGTLDYGQGHVTPFAQVLHERLGVPLDRVRLLQGDSDQLVAGGGTGGSKSLMASGTAIWEASDLVIERGRAIAAHLLEAGVGDVEFADGRFTIVGTDRAVGLMDLAEKVSGGLTVEGQPASLDVTHVHKESPSAYPNGCHVAEVEVDPETGVAEVVRYTTVNDFGTLVNPLLVEGQVHGGVVQGIGQALHERTHYDEDGQLVTGSFMDYCLPRAADAPSMGFESRPVPASTNPLGAKGCGEAGCAGALPAVMNALVDALRPRGVTHINMPATPQRIWAALAEAAA